VTQLLLLDWQELLRGADAGEPAIHSRVWLIVWPLAAWMLRAQGVTAPPSWYAAAGAASGPATPVQYCSYMGVNTVRMQVTASGGDAGGEFDLGVRGQPLTSWVLALRARLNFDR